jgi:hypothetical protein
LQLTSASLSLSKFLAVGFTTAASLVHQLMEARDEKRLLRLHIPLANSVRFVRLVAETFSSRTTWHPPASSASRWIVTS